MVCCAANVNRSVTAAWLYNIVDTENSYFGRGSSQAACKIQGGEFATQEDYDDCDEIICMDKRNKREIKALYGDSKSIIVLDIEDKFKAFEQKLITELLVAFPD